MNLPNLNKLMRYKNDKIISRYSKDYPNAKMHAEEALKELMKFVWLCHKYRVDKKTHANDNSLNFSCVIHSEMSDIDNMWHTFLLFTRDYHDFCNHYLDGVFFHHEPLIDSNKNVFDKNDEEELTLYLSYIYDNLGESTLIKWFNESVAIEDVSCS
ncbi:hypothetical protein [Legionella sainthelensi]|uniref:hypothetical protein n=1 Tax=Legionella sainthelensi TaxID=28087 RepID=UPI000E1FF3F9|nr:hypothetical protein [Legionella sainthelensi]